MDLIIHNMYFCKPSLISASFTCPLSTNKGCHVVLGSGMKRKECKKWSINSLFIEVISVNIERCMFSLREGMLRVSTIDILKAII